MQLLLQNVYHVFLTDFSEVRFTRCAFSTTQNKTKRHEDAASIFDNASCCACKSGVETHKNKTPKSKHFAPDFKASVGEEFLAAYSEGNALLQKFIVSMVFVIINNVVITFQQYKIIMKLFEKRIYFFLCK